KAEHREPREKPVRDEEGRPRAEREDVRRDRSDAEDGAETAPAERADRRKRDGGQREEVRRQEERPVHERRAQGLPQGPARRRRLDGRGEEGLSGAAPLARATERAAAL